MTEHDGFKWTDDDDDELSAVDALWIAMGWLGEAVFQRATWSSTAPSAMGGCWRDRAKWE